MKRTKRHTKLDPCYQCIAVWIPDRPDHIILMAPSTQVVLVGSEPKWSICRRTGYALAKPGWTWGGFSGVN